MLLKSYILAKLKRFGRVVIFGSGVVFGLIFGLETALWLIGFPSAVEQFEAYQPRSRYQRDNLEFNYAFTTNSLGFRDGELGEKISRRRILFLGDSYTEGVGVAESERFTDLLRESFRKKNYKLDTINAGVTAIGPFHYARILFHQGLKLQPELTVICVFANDVQNMGQKFDPDAIVQSNRDIFQSTGVFGRPKLYLPRSYRLYTRSRSGIAAYFKPSFEKQLEEWIVEHKLLPARVNQWKQSIPTEVYQGVVEGKVNPLLVTTGLLRPKYFVEALDLAETPERERLAVLIQTLEFINQQVKSGKLALVYLPTPLQYNSLLHQPGSLWVKTGTIVRSEWLVDESNFERALREFSGRMQIPYLSTTSALREATKLRQLEYSLDGHLNRDGHAAVAAVLEPFILEFLK